jgi:hypothetical protein
MAHDGSTAQQPQQQMLLWLNLLARSMSTTDDLEKICGEASAVKHAHSRTQPIRKVQSVFGGGRAAETTQTNTQHSIHNVYT